MRICLVLGAGSSLANAEHFRRRRNTKTHPPLDYTFFDKIRELGIRVPADLEAYAAELPTGSPFEAPPRSNRMEEFLRDLFHDFLLERATANSQPVRAYRHLVQMYAEVLRDTTNWMTRDKRTGGPIGRLIASGGQRVACGHHHVQPRPRHRKRDL